jgi:hypothetical protein
VIFSSGSSSDLSNYSTEKKGVQKLSQARHATASRLY